MKPANVRQIALALATILLIIMGKLVLSIGLTHAMTLVGKKSMNATTAEILIHFHRQHQHPHPHQHQHQHQVGLATPDLGNTVSPQLTGTFAQVVQLHSRPAVATGHQLLLMLVAMDLISPMWLAACASMPEELAGSTKSLGLRSDLTRLGSH